MMNVILLFIFLFTRLDEQLRYFCERNKRRTSERSRLLVFIGSSRRRIDDFLAVIDAQCRVNRRCGVILHGLFFVAPAVVKALVAVRLTDNPSWLNASSDEHIRINGTPMITALVG